MQLVLVAICLLFCEAAPKGEAEYNPASFEPLYHSRPSWSAGKAIKSKLKSDSLSEEEEEEKRLQSNAFKEGSYDIIKSYRVAQEAEAKEDGIPIKSPKSSSSEISSDGEDTAAASIQRRGADRTINSRDEVQAEAKALQEFGTSKQSEDDASPPPAMSPTSPSADFGARKSFLEEINLKPKRLVDPEETTTSRTKDDEHQEEEENSLRPKHKDVLSLMHAVLDSKNGSDSESQTPADGVEKNDAGTIIESATDARPVDLMRARLLQKGFSGQKEQQTEVEGSSGLKTIDNDPNQNIADRVQMEYDREIMLKDSNPDFKKNVEKLVLERLIRDGKTKGYYQSSNASEKVLNWKIINHGKQTIIVL